VPGRHVRAPGERLDVQRLRVLPVDPVADLAQPCEVTQALSLGRSAGHTHDGTLRSSRCRALAGASRFLTGLVTCIARQDGAAARVCG
jgi:hypothetical protein